MTRLAIIVGSTRPGRSGSLVAEWLHDAAARHPAVTTGRATIDLVDLAEIDLPRLDEPVPALMGQYAHVHTRRWAQLVDRYDGFVFLTPEYNHSLPASLKDAIDYLFAEWNDKAAGLASYGTHGGVRAAEHLRQVLAEVKVATVRSQVTLSVYTDFAYDEATGDATLTPADHHEPALHEMLDEVLDWAAALATLRTSSSLAS